MGVCSFTQRQDATIIKSNNTNCNKPNSNNNEKDINGNNSITSKNNDKELKQNKTISDNTDKNITIKKKNNAQTSNTKKKK